MKKKFPAVKKDITKVLLNHSKIILGLPIVAILGHPVMPVDNVHGHNGEHVTLEIDGNSIFLGHSTNDLTDLEINSTCSAQSVIVNGHFSQAAFSNNQTVVIDFIHASHGSHGQW